MSVDMDHPEKSYSDIICQEGEFGGPLEAHVAGLVLSIEISIHNASTSGEIFRVGCEGEVVANILYDAIDVRCDGLEPLCSWGLEKTACVDWKWLNVSSSRV